MRRLPPCRDRLSSHPGGRSGASPRRTRAHGRRTRRSAIERAAQELGLTRDATVLDLAAGTGNLTRALREQFAHVIAVEPDAGMRAQFDGEVLAGTAEAIPLADGSVDAVFVGEAFHWFDAERALAEIRRVGRRARQSSPAAGARSSSRGCCRRRSGRSSTRSGGASTARRGDFPDWRDIVQPEGPVRFEETVRISGRDLVDLHLTGSTPASIPTTSGRRSRSARIR